jgi:CHAT domain-containing protein
VLTVQAHVAVAEWYQVLQSRNFRTKCWIARPDTFPFDTFPLPGVSDEIKQLAEILPATVLLNESYSKKRLDQTIKQTSFRIIHIASHGVFGGSASESYIMAHDKIINITELETLLQSKSNRDNPIELLTLSACQTAEGDDRSPLGISGIALKAKVRSAIGSLWSVADIATVNFMTSFYQQLKTANTSKAHALQHAQQHLLNNPEYQHPFFWSPFILIGNWL